MSRAKSKAKKTATASLSKVCEERIACVSDKEPPVVRCDDCGTLQCESCDEELHKEGDSFFHVRTKLVDQKAASSTTTTTSTSTVVGDPVVTTDDLNLNQKKLTTIPGGKKSLDSSRLTSNKKSSSAVVTQASARVAHATDHQQHNKDGGTNNIPHSRTVNHNDAVETTNLKLTLHPPSNHNPFSATAASEKDCGGAVNNRNTGNIDNQKEKFGSAEELGPRDLPDCTKLFESGDFRTADTNSFSILASSTYPSRHGPNVGKSEFVSQPNFIANGELEFSSDEFVSLGLDSILACDISSADMKGQSSKPSKRTKAKKSTSNVIHSSTADSQFDSSRKGIEGYGPVHDQLPPNEFPSSDCDDDEALVSNLIRSIKVDGTHSEDVPSVAPRKSGGTKQSLKLEKPSQGSSFARSFVLIDETETLQVSSGRELLAKLNCADANVKVVSIFGNTGDGKSYTLNRIFFDGEEVFATSADQDTCTVGVWASYDPHTKVMCIDTEGLLGVTNNQNKRTRLLLKILAISDVVIYRTSADRLHTDLFQFLGDASQAYNKHFKVELEALKSQNGRRLLQDLGPSVVIFHETVRTNTLDMSGGGKSADEILRERFATLDKDMSSFSSIRYVGVKTSKPPTDFTPLIACMRKEIDNCSVRSPRSPLVIFDMLKILNQKFNGEMYSHSPNSFPDEFFTCTSKCLACTSRCELSMNHKSHHHQATQCRYVHAYDNRSYICKKCLEKGRKNEVVPKTCASDDNSIMGVAKYMMAGYVLECRDCGIIYKSRQHWYGNKEPTETAVQVEVKHMWPGQAARPTGTHNAAWKVLDGVKVVADTVSAYGSKPTKMLSDWVADQIAPSYWVPNNEVLECHSCRREFGEQEKKHHCRGCGQGFCDDCTQFSKPVPQRGWGPSPVRVCEKCYQLPTGAVSLSPDRDVGEANSLMPRQIVENVQSVLGAVASVAIDYPIEVIKDSARPAYWVPDHLIKTCHVCQAEFGPKLAIHHCRACGHGVCRDCSDRKRQVPSKGWDKLVRVCDACYKKEGVL